MFKKEKETMKDKKKEQYNEERSGQEEAPKVNTSIPIFLPLTCITKKS